jgi:mannose-6-phosphate isomerase-like protein (cupin superfamily)
MEADGDRYEGVEVQEPGRRQVVERIHAQAEQWGLKIPDVPCHPFHFGFDDFARIGETEFWIANEVKAGYCAKLMFVFADQECPYHHHRVKHETFLVLKGAARMVVDGKRITMTAGDVLPVPPGTRHSFTGDRGACLLLEVSMPSVAGDSFFEDTRIGSAGTI